MTISSTNTKNSYSGDGSTVAFSYTFKILDDDDIQVILRTNATGTETVQTKTTHYSVSGVGNAGGGTITFVSAPAATETVVLIRAIPLTQTTDYTPNDPFPAVTHEDALDKLTLMAQDTQEEVDRSIKLSRTNTMTSTEFTVGATTRANKIFAFDSSGELAVTQEIGTFQGDWAASTAYAERDLVKDTSTNNIFIVNSAHTSSGSQPLTTNTNSSKYDLIVDAASATTSATNAATSATAAAASATAAAASESAAATSETNAAASEAGVAADAAAAAASASSASTSATNASTSETNASNSASAAATSATNAATSATSASNSASAAGTSETNAATSATNAANSAAAASTSASNAATSESNASTSESNASTSASSASTSASAAAASAASAAASFDAFDDIYLGAKASAPSVDNDGDALTTGDLYFDTGDNELYIWNGSAWQAASPNIVADTTPQLGGNLDTNGNDINFGDNDKAVFGAGSDLQIYHDGSDSILKENGTGGVLINNPNDLTLFNANVAGGVVKLFHVGSGVSSEKLATTSTGIDVTGSVTAHTVEIGDGSAGGTSEVVFSDNVSGRAKILYDHGASPNEEMGFEIAGTRYMTIENGGNIGIGTDSPSSSAGFQARLAVHGSGSPGLILRDTDTAQENVVGTNGAGLYIESAGHATASNNAIIFRTENTNSAFSATERMRITSAGNVGIGTSSPTADGLQIVEATQPDFFMGNTADPDGFRITYNSTDTSIGTHSNTPLRIRTNGTERMRIDSSGNVGIGTTSPDAKLDLGTTVANNVFALYSDGTNFYGQGIGGNNYKLLVPSSASFTFNSYNYTGDSTTERVRINSSGTLLVGKTSAATNVEGGELRENGQVIAVATNVNPFFGARLGSDGDLAVFRKDSTTVGSIASRGGVVTNIILDPRTATNGGAGIGATGATAQPAILPTDESTVADNNTNLGSSSTRWKDLYLSGGAYLGGTAAANKLDDYEEGTWDPEVGGTATYNFQRGTYTKIGNIVSVTFDISINSIGTGSTTTMSGFPFASSSDIASLNYTGSVSYFAGLNLSNVFLGLYMQTGVSQCVFVGGVSSATTISNNAMALFGDGARVAGSITYRTA